MDFVGVYDFARYFTAIAGGFDMEGVEPMGIRRDIQQEERLCLFAIDRHHAVTDRTEWLTAGGCKIGDPGSVHRVVVPLDIGAGEDIAAVVDFNGVGFCEGNFMSLYQLKGKRGWRTAT